jgi:hypothetical protein
MKTLNWPQSYASPDGYLLDYLTLNDNHDWHKTGPIYYSKEQHRSAFYFWKSQINILLDAFAKYFEYDYYGDEDGGSFVQGDDVIKEQVVQIIQAMMESGTIPEFVERLNNLSGLGLEIYFDAHNPRPYQISISGDEEYDTYLDIYLLIDLKNQKFRYYYHDYNDSETFITDFTLTRLSNLIARGGLF